MLLLLSETIPTDAKPKHVNKCDEQTTEVTCSSEKIKRARKKKMRDPITHVKQSMGQALVEMVIILPLLLLLVMGIFEFGRAMYIKNTLTHSARAGARAAVVTPGVTAATSVIPNSGCNYPDATGNDRVYQAVCTSLYNGINKPDVRIDVTINDISAPTGLGQGDMVEVNVTLINYHSNYRIIPFIPVPDQFGGKTAMRYE